jgi:hypothetical protein
MRFEVLTATCMKMAVFWMLHRVVWSISTRVSEELTASIIRLVNYLMMEAVSSSETSVSIYVTTRYNIQKTAILITVYSGASYWTIS